MQRVITKECTECLFDSPPEETILDFRTRTTHILNHFDQNIFNSEDRHPEDRVLDAIGQLKRQTARVCPAKRLQDNLMMMDEEMNERSQGLDHSADHSLSPRSKPWDQLSWKEKINRKKELVKDCILKQAIPNLTSIARYTKMLLLQSVQ